VFVFGAGASHGETLVPLSDDPALRPKNDATPPLIDGFFSRLLYDSIGYPGDQAEKDFKQIFDYVRESFGISEHAGQGKWADLNIEEVFTSVELDREFMGREGDAWAKATVTRNDLVRYLGRVISYCTQGKRGLSYGKIKSFTDAHPDVSVLTFNWDLLLDQEFMERVGLGWGISAGPYSNFDTIVMGGEAALTGGFGRWPLYLKLHGSLNWLQCMNPTCPGASRISILADTQLCLVRAMGFPGSGTVLCNQCGSEMGLLLVPPVLKKPLSEKGVIRAAWGQATHRLGLARKVVIIGFSASPTDFHASWLLRSTLGGKPKHATEVFVVNPQNRADHPRHEDSTKRMAAIFRSGYNSEFQTFCQIDSILERVA
jgi:hypothetical protein